MNLSTSPLTMRALARSSSRPVTYPLSLKRVLIPSLCAVLLVACGRDLRTSRGIVEEFLDHHYVYIDLEKAKEYTVGLARHKIDEEIRLTKDQVIDATTRKPRIHYRLLEKKEAGKRVSFIYEATIRAEDAPQFTRRLLITARKDGKEWRVSNFTEYD